MLFILGLSSIEKLIQFDCCKGHLNKALIDQKYVYVYCLFGTGWIRGFVLNSSSKLKPEAKNNKYSHNHHSPLNLAWKIIADNH